jgi:Ca2+-binding RTX toxin-like protein
MAFDISLSGTQVTLDGSTGDDVVAISVAPSGHFRHDIALGGNLVSDIDADSTLPGEQSILAASVTHITINGNDGNDTTDASLWVGIGITVYGGEGTDTIKGGSGNDQLNGQGGNDTIYGNDGNDSRWWHRTRHALGRR